MNILEKYDRQFAYTGALMNLSLAIQAFVLWTNPSIDDATKIYSIAVLVGFEFFMVHSGVFMASFPRKISLFIFFPLYGAFALVINQMVDGNFVLYLYLVVVFQRMRLAFSDVNQALKEKAILYSGYAAILWIFLVMIVLFNHNHIPLFGLTESYLKMSGYRDLHSIGDFTKNPHTATAFAVLYYLFLALTEFNLTRSLIKNPKRFRL